MYEYRKINPINNIEILSSSTATGTRKDQSKEPSAFQKILDAEIRKLNKAITNK